MMIKRGSGEKAAMNGICGNCFINWYNGLIKCEYQIAELHLEYLYKNISIGRSNAWNDEGEPLNGAVYFYECIKWWVCRLKGLKEQWIRR